MQKKSGVIIGYTTGVYDLFHIGHLNLLKNAKGLCDKLVVGVTVDELVSYKGKKALISFEDRIEIVRSCKYVDAAIPQYDMDKLVACKKLGARQFYSSGMIGMVLKNGKIMSNHLKTKGLKLYTFHIHGVYQARKSMKLSIQCRSKILQSHPRIKNHSSETISTQKLCGCCRLGVAA